MILKVRESILEKCREMEQDARDQATDNAILRQLREVLCLSFKNKVYLIQMLNSLNNYLFFHSFKIVF